MCRWAAYIGQPIFIEQIVSLPEHSLIEQSQCATKAKTAINADGFGLAWYADRKEPAYYRDVMPAWADENLLSLTRQIKSRLFMAHVRASTGTPTSRENCHPFCDGSWSFMHNGQIGSFEKLRRKLENLLNDTFYERRRGQSDSELMFLLALQFGLTEQPVKAFEQTMAAINSVAHSIGVTPHIRFSAALSDGIGLWGFRYATDQHAPTLFVQESETGWSLVSEPYVDVAANWIPIKAGSFVHLDGKQCSNQSFCEARDKIA